MNKSELAKHILESTDLDFSHKKVVDMIDVLIEVIGAELSRENGKVKLVGFGSLKADIKKKKKARNPRTGEEIIIPRRRTVKFISGNSLKESLNK